MDESKTQPSRQDVYDQALAALSRLTEKPKLETEDVIAMDALTRLVATLKSD